MTNEGKSSIDKFHSRHLSSACHYCYRMKVLKALFVSTIFQEHVHTFHLMMMTEELRSKEGKKNIRKKKKVCHWHERLQAINFLIYV